MSASRFRMAITSANKLLPPGPANSHQAEATQSCRDPTHSPFSSYVHTRTFPAESKLTLRMDECRFRRPSDQSTSSVPHSAGLVFYLITRRPWFLAFFRAALLTRPTERGPRPLIPQPKDAETPCSPALQSRDHRFECSRWAPLAARVSPVMQRLPGRLFATSWHSIKLQSEWFCELFRQPVHHRQNEVHRRRPPPRWCLLRRSFRVYLQLRQGDRSLRLGRLVRPT